MRSTEFDLQINRTMAQRTEKYISSNFTQVNYIPTKIELNSTLLVHIVNQTMYDSFISQLQKYII